MPDVAGFLEDLVRIPSPSGEEDKAAERFAEEAKALGFGVTTDGVGNVLAEAGDGPVRVLLAGHLDTVPGPIPVRVEDGVLHGRGAVDAKGPLAALLYGAADPPSGVTVTVAALVGEEDRSRGARHLVERGGDRDHVVVGEPTGGDGVAVAYRGRRLLRTTVERPGRHPAHPDRGAADVLVDELAELRSEDGDRIVAVRDVDVVEDGNRSRAEAVVDVRAADEAALDAAVDALPGADVEVLEAVPPVETDRTDPVVVAFVDAVRSRGVRPRLVRKTGTCDANRLQELSSSICVYGPGRSELDHTPDERIRLDEVAGSADVVADALARLAD